MSVAQLRREAARDLKGLPDEKVLVVHDFIRFLRDGASDEATAELLRIPGLLGQLRQARRDQAAGKGRDWREVRREVYE